MFTQRGEVCSPYENVTSLPGRIKTKGIHTEFHQISYYVAFDPRRAIVTVVAAKYHISVAFSIKLPLKLIWLKVSSAFNLGQRQQWNFPSLSRGA